MSKLSFKGLVKALPLVAVLVFLAAACGPPEEFNFTFADHGEEIFIDPGEFITVRLPYDPADTFQWAVKFARIDTLVLEEGSPTIETAEDGTQLIAFTLKSPGRGGQTPLQIWKMDPADADAEPSEKFQLSVWVR